MDEPAIAPGDRLTLEVITGTGRAAAVDLLVRSESVEVWHHHRVAAEFDRDDLRRWLAHPDLPLTRAGVAFGVDRTVDVNGRTAITDLHGRVAVSLPDVEAWPLTPGELDKLLSLI